VALQNIQHGERFGLLTRGNSPKELRNTGAFLKQVAEIGTEAV
jgi:hypothetical protein